MIVINPLTVNVAQLIKSKRRSVKSDYMLSKNYTVTNLHNRIQFQIQKSHTARKFSDILKRFSSKINSHK